MKITPSPLKSYIKAIVWFAIAYIFLWPVVYHMRASYFTAQYGEILRPYVEHHVPPENCYPEPKYERYKIIRISNKRIQVTIECPMFAVLLTSKTRKGEKWWKNGHTIQGSLDSAIYSDLRMLSLAYHPLHPHKDALTSY